MPPKKAIRSRAKATGPPETGSQAQSAPENSNETLLFHPAPFDIVDSDEDDSSTKIPREKSTTIEQPRNESPTRIDVSDDSDHSADEDTGLESDDDPVVRSYDVYMTSELAQHLYLFQYPVRSSTRPYTNFNNSCPVDARLKPKSGLVELDVPVNTTINFDEEKGRVWGDVLRKAKAADEGGLAGKASFQRGGKRRKMKDESDDEEDEDNMYQDFNEALKKGKILNRQTLGSKMQPDDTRYMTGVFKNDKLHLTPIKSTLQLRPQFSHVDAQGAQDRAANRALRDADQPEKPAEARAVHMSVKSTSDPSAQISSTMKALRLAEGEEWKELHWVDQDNDEAWDQYEYLCLDESRQGNLLKCETSKDVYMEYLSGAALERSDGK